MSLKAVVVLTFIVAVNAFVIENNNETYTNEVKSEIQVPEKNLNDIFDGVYSECFFHLSYSCLQKKTLLYLKELNKLSEVSVIGDYVKFVKTNDTEISEDVEEDTAKNKNPEDLSFYIDRAVDKFFNNHILKFNALGKDITVPDTAEDFVGRKRKGGGGGGGHHGMDDGGKKKMMMMAMMCMKMKLMMMVPAMMGMMGMMSFKGMMFSMMSFMVSKMMLLMKILEKKGGGGGGGGGDGGWAAGGGGGGAWMPAGGDYGGGGGGGGGYDANGQWQSRSILERNLESYEYNDDLQEGINKPIISYVTPIVRYNNKINMKKPYAIVKKLNDEVIKLNQNQKDVRTKRETRNDGLYIEDAAEGTDSSSEKNEEFDGNGNDSNSVSDSHFNHKLKKTSEKSWQKSIGQSNNMYTNDVHARMKRQIPIYDSSISLEYGPDSYEIDTEYNMPLRRFDNDFPYTKQNNLPKTRSKRGIVDVLQNAYTYWINKVLGMTNYKKYQPKYPKYKVINGVKYVYMPLRQMPKAKAPKILQNIQPVTEDDGFKPIVAEPIVAEDFKPSQIITADDFNKGEIVEGAVESRMTKKLKEFKDTVSDALDDSPWQ